MAANYLEKHREDYETWKAQRERKHKLRLRRALEAYRRRLQQEQSSD